MNAKDLSIDSLLDDVELQNLAERGTDLDNSAFFARRAKDRWRYNASAKSWMVYDRTHWRFAELAEVIGFAKDVVREMQQSAVEMPLKDHSLRVAALKHAMACGSRKRLEAMVFLAQSDLLISPASFNADPWAFNTLSGPIDLRMRKLGSHRAEDYISKLARVAYDSEARCPRWLQFLNEVMLGRAELVDFLQRFVGLCMTGIVVEHLFAIMYGGGANGKTTLLTVLGMLLGDYGLVVDPALFTAQRDSKGPSPELVRLHGVRFVSAAEMPENARLAEGLMKRLTGGDTIAARDLYSGVIEIRPTWKIAIATNHRPAVRDSSEGFWRRMHLIPFEATFAGPQQDEKLTEKLIAELPGILNWALDGCERWQREGLGKPVDVERATAEYRADTDVIAQFIDERCFVIERASVRAPALYRAFVDWAKENGEKRVPSAKGFRTTLRARGYIEKRTHGADIFNGIGLRDDER